MRARVKECHEIHRPRLLLTPSNSCNQARFSNAVPVGLVHLDIWAIFSHFHGLLAKSEKTVFFESFSFET